MKLVALQPFIPSGNSFIASKELFVVSGFNITWGAGDYVGFENNGCKFILQKFDKRERFMILF